MRPHEHRKGFLHYYKHEENHSINMKTTKADHLLQQKMTKILIPLH